MNTDRGLYGTNVQTWLVWCGFQRSWRYLGAMGGFLVTYPSAIIPEAGCLKCYPRLFSKGVICSILDLERPIHQHFHFPQQVLKKRLKGLIALMTFWLPDRMYMVLSIKSILELLFGSYWHTRVFLKTSQLVYLGLRYFSVYITPF